MSRDSAANRPQAIDAAAVSAARTEELPEETLVAVVETFEALADGTRARILYALTRRPLCVRDLAVLVGVSESAVSHQLRFLRDRRLVKPRRSGNVIHYAVDDQHVAALFREAEYHVDHIHEGRPDHPYPDSRTMPPTPDGPADPSAD
jgi:ArsR family transcriptional regulator, lead/cadmium/zinc/bismuth-responsive transcriptional repressor